MTEQNIKLFLNLVNFEFLIVIFHFSFLVFNLAKRLPLSLFVFRVFAYYIYPPSPTNELAMFTNLFNRRHYFHIIIFPYTLFSLAFHRIGSLQPLPCLPVKLLSDKAAIFQPNGKGFPRPSPVLP